MKHFFLIAIAAVLTGTKSWNGIKGSRESKRDWLKTFLKLPSGVPWHDTFNQVFTALDPEKLKRNFVVWLRLSAQLTAGAVVAGDGEASRGTWESGKKQLIDMLPAWAGASNIVLFQSHINIALSNEHREQIEAIHLRLKNEELDYSPLSSWQFRRPLWRL